MSLYEVLAPWALFSWTPTGATGSLSIGVTLRETLLDLLRRMLDESRARGTLFAPQEADMARASVKQGIAVPVDKLWALVADFGDTGWMPGDGSNVTLEGEGPGMARIISAGDMKIREQLESVDEATRTLVYTIPEGVPFPVENYRSTIKVTADGDASELEWTCTCDPAGVTDEQATQLIEVMYGTMIGWIRDTITA